MTLRVTHVITGLEAGGAEGFLARLAPVLESRATVISLRDDGIHAAGLRAAGIPVDTVGMGDGMPDPRWAARLLSLLRRSRPDVVQTWLYHADLLGGLAGRALRRPVVWNLRQTLVPDGPQPLGRLVAIGARLSPWLPAAVAAVSEPALEDHLAAGYRPRRTVVLPNGFDLERFRPDAGAAASVRAELGLAAGTPLIGMVARADPQKDHATAFAAVALLAERGIDAHLVLCGRGTEVDGALAGAVRAAGVADRVHHLGERRDLPHLQAAWDLALSTSSYGEGLSNAVAEAMACAVPAVVTSVGAGAELVGTCGEVVGPGRPDAVADALERLLSRPPAERARLGAAARARVAERYSLAAAAARYDALYREVAGGRG